MIPRLAARAILLASLGLLGARGTGSARAAVIARGTVVVGVAELGSGAPIPDAEVRFPALRRVARTNWMGEVRFDSLPAGRHRLEVRKVGYASSNAEIMVGRETTGPVFMLERLPAVTLDTVRVREPVFSTVPAEFEWRRRLGIGRFITDSVFQSEGTNDLATVLATRLLGLIIRRGPGDRLMFSSSSCGRVEVYLDNVLVWPDPSELIRGAQRMRDTDFPHLAPRDLAGAEFYRAYSAPPQYRPPGRGCAVLLLWSSPP
jgi:hypothetical protein